MTTKDCLIETVEHSPAAELLTPMPEPGSKHGDAPMKVRHQRFGRTCQLRTR